MRNRISDDDTNDSDVEYIEENEDEFENVYEEELLVINDTMVLDDIQSTLDIVKHLS